MTDRFDVIFVYLKLVSNTSADTIDIAVIRVSCANSGNSFGSSGHFLSLEEDEITLRSSLKNW